MTGRLLQIFLRPGARLPVRAVDSATAIAGQGLEGDHAVGGRRQVTLLSLAAWTAACRELGGEVGPAVRRANLVVDGLDLASAIGSEIAVGDVRVEVLGETRPCELLEAEGRFGLCATLRPERRGGVHGRIHQGGDLRVGMPCAVLAKEAPERPTDRRPFDVSSATPLPEPP